MGLLMILNIYLILGNSSEGSHKTVERIREKRKGRAIKERQGKTVWGEKA